MFAVGVVQIPIFTRLTRSMVLSLRKQDFIQSVRSLRATPTRIIFRHILPASLVPLVVQATLSIGTATLEAAGLGFLGLGAQPPNPELALIWSADFKDKALMNSSERLKQAEFILKVLVISTGLSILIKYGGPILSIPATPNNALTLVFVPTLMVALALWLRTLQKK